MTERVSINGVIHEIEISPAEIAQREAEERRLEAEYWKNTPYDDLVNAEIRKRYSESQEFSILRQKDEKPTEYAEYFQYCEQCKALVKSKILQISEQ